MMGSVPQMLMIIVRQLNQQALNGQGSGVCVQSSGIGGGSIEISIDYLVEDITREEEG